MIPEREYSLEIEREKSLFKRAQSIENVGQLQEIVTSLYSHILELTDKILSLREERTGLMHERELLSENNLQQEQQLNSIKSYLVREKAALKEALARLVELEATASELTIWNGSLEQQCITLKESLLQCRTRATQCQQNLQDDLLEATRKQIALRDELDLLEEEGLSLRRSLRESQDINGRLFQENAILKSKLFNMTFCGGKSPLTTTTSIVKDSSLDFNPTRLETVKLESNLGIGDILGQLKLASIGGNQR